jgi:hypothetical protein
MMGCAQGKNGVGKNWRGENLVHMYGKIGMAKIGVTR